MRNLTAQIERAKTNPRHYRAILDLYRAKSRQLEERDRKMAAEREARCHIGVRQG